MHVSSCSYNRVCAVDYSEVLELSAKRKILALKEKRALEMLRVATEFGFGKSTVYDIIKLKDELLGYSLNVKQMMDLSKIK